MCSSKISRIVDERCGWGWCLDNSQDTRKQHPNDDTECREIPYSRTEDMARGIIYHDILRCTRLTTTTTDRCPCPLSVALFVGCAIACVAFLRPLRGDYDGDGDGDGDGEKEEGDEDGRLSPPPNDAAERDWLSVVREGLPTTPSSSPSSSPSPSPSPYRTGGMKLSGSILFDLPPR